MRPMARAKGQGTITPIAPSPAGVKRWRVAVTMASGQRVWRTAHSPREAERIRAQLVEARELELDPTRQTLADYLRSWVGGMREARNARVSVTTVDHYAFVSERHIIPVLGGYRLAAVNPTRVQAWLDGIDGAPRSVIHYHAILRRALAVAVKRRLLPYNPADSVEIPDAGAEVGDPLTVEEAQAILEATREDWLGPLWRLVLVTGNRRGELLGLSWDDVGPDSITVRAQLARRNGTWALVPTKAARKVAEVHIDADTATLLDKHRRRMAEARTPEWQYHGLVFVTTDGRPWHGREILTEWHRACKKAGVRERRFHDTRHTNLSILADLGVTEDTRQNRAGHNTTAMARKYAQASEAQDRDAAERIGRALGG